MKSSDEILVLTNDEGRVCARCGKRLPLTSFYRSRKRKDTYQSYCIRCSNEYKADRRYAKKLLRLNLVDIPFGEIGCSTDLMSRSELIIMKRILIGILRKIDRKLGKESRYRG